MRREDRGGEGLEASLNPHQAGIAISVSWFFSQLLLLGAAALCLCLGTLIFTEKGMRGLQLTSLVFDALPAVFNIPKEHKIHELFSKGNTLLCLPSLNMIQILQIRAAELWSTRTRLDGPC